MEPTDLPSPLHLCLNLENQNFRTVYAYKNKNQNPNFRMYEQKPIPAPRTVIPNYNPIYGQPPPVPPRRLLPKYLYNTNPNNNTYGIRQRYQPNHIQPNYGAFTLWLSPSHIHNSSKLFQFDQRPRNYNQSQNLWMWTKISGR